ncbi:MAG: SDR family NAD(P)-dependent oxidoreductase [Pseudomonadota bacterium]
MTQKTVLITGASRGLGAAMAEVLAPAYHVIAVAKTVGALEELDDRIKAKGGEATLAPMDITNDGAMQHLCKSIYDRWGKIDLWVHAAVHAAPLSPASHINQKDWDKSFAVNTRATSRLIAYVAPLLGTTGRAVFFDDTTIATPFYGSYGASKAAQTALVRSWQAETKKTGPRIDIANPKAMPTATRGRFHPGEDRSKLTDPANEAKRIVNDLAL